MVARSEMDSNPCSGQLVGRREIIVEFLAGSGIAGLLPLGIPLESGTFQNLPRFRGSLQTI